MGKEGAMWRRKRLYRNEGARGKGPGSNGKAKEGNEGTREDMRGPGGRDWQRREGEDHGRRKGHGGGITCCFSIPDEFGAVGSKGLTVYQFHYICFDDHKTRLVPNICSDDHNSFLTEKRRSHR